MTSIPAFGNSLGQAVVLSLTLVSSMLHNVSKLMAVSTTITHWKDIFIYVIKTYYNICIPTSQKVDYQMRLVVSAAENFPSPLSYYLHEEIAKISSVMTFLLFLLCNLALLCSRLWFLCLAVHDHAYGHVSAYFQSISLAGTMSRRYRTRINIANLSTLKL